MANDAFFKGFNSMFQLMGIKQTFENAKELSEYRKNMAEVERTRAETAQKQLEMAREEHDMDMINAQLAANQKYAGLLEDERNRQKLGVARLATGLQVEAGLPGAEISRNIAQYAPTIKEMVQMVQGKSSGYAPGQAKAWRTPEGPMAYTFAGEKPPPESVPWQKPAEEKAASMTEIRYMAAAGGPDAWDKIKNRTATPEEYKEFYSKLSREDLITFLLSGETRKPAKLSEEEYDLMAK